MAIQVFVFVFLPVYCTVCTAFGLTFEISLATIDLFNDHRLQDGRFSSTSLSTVVAVVLLFLISNKQGVSALN